jgi:hypothetical protein
VISESEIKITEAHGIFLTLNFPFCKRYKGDSWMKITPKRKRTGMIR